MGILKKEEVRVEEKEEIKEIKKEKKKEFEFDFKKKKENVICSLNEIECFLNNFQSVYKYIALYKILK